MKPVAFNYVRPTTPEEACAVLAADLDARVLAGGQTLMPMLNMRLARPSTLVDITRIVELKGIAKNGDRIVIGAAMTQAAALLSDVVTAEIPLLAKALPWVGHGPTRARGTVGGSLAHADPSAEIALCAVTLGAEIVFMTTDGEETFEAEDFFLGPTVTLAPMGGLMTKVQFPVKPAGRVGTGFHEIASRRSDYAFASAAAQVVMDEIGKVSAARIGIGSVGDVPVAIDASPLTGSALSDDEIGAFLSDALRDLEVVDDLHATASYRMRAAGELARRALVDAREEALAS